MSDPVTNGTETLSRPEKPAAFQVSVDVNNPTSLYLDTAVFNQINRVAVMMASSKLAPKHLQGADKVADCILVVAQALRWKSDPFAVAQHTFVLQGKLGYEGKLIAAMVNASGKLKEPLDYTYSGEGDDRKIVVSGTFKGADKERTVEGTIGKWKTANEHWKKDPDQMAAYRGARQWARRHMPEVLLGVNSEEEMAPRSSMIDVTPGTGAAAINEALANVVPPSPADDLRTVDGEVVDTVTGEILDAGDAAEAKTAERERIISADDDINAYLAGVIEDADLCDTIAALDALDADVRKNIKQKTKQMQAWNAHKAKREVEILNRKRT